MPTLRPMNFSTRVPARVDAARVDAALRQWRNLRTGVREPVHLDANVEQPLPRPRGLNVDWSRDATPPQREDEAFGGGALRALVRIAVWTITAILFYLGNLGDTLRRRSSQLRRAQRLRKLIQRTGPTAIKIAQQASMRIDVIPYVYAHELAKLLDDVPPFPAAQAIGAVEKAIGGPLDATFAAFDPEPIGSASLACVYHAFLRSGDEVAVKVRRPGVGEAIATDLRALRLVMNCLEFLFLLPPDFTKHILHELGDMLFEELNFTKEARHTELFGRELKKARLRWARAPRIYFELSSRNVLVEEFVSGIFLSDILGAVEHEDYTALAVLRSREIDPKLVARRLLLVARFGGFESLLFHADLHPANVLVENGSRLVLIDFGSCGNFTKTEREVWRRFLEAQNHNDVGRMAKAALGLIEPLPPIDVDAFTKQLESVFFQDMYATKSKHSVWWERTSANIWISFLRLAREYDIPLQLNTLRMIRVTMLADTIAVRLDNSMDIYHEYRRYEKGAGKRARKSIRKRTRRLLGKRGYIQIEQVFDTVADYFYSLQRIFSNRAILNFSMLAGKASFAIDRVLRGLGFLAAVEGSAAAILLLAHALFGGGPAAVVWLDWILLPGRDVPAGFWQILAALGAARWSQVLFAATALWTVVRIHKRLDDADTHRWEGRER